MFIYWMFKLHSEFSKSFPGVIGIHKSLAAVRQCDENVRKLLDQIPAKLSLPPNYVPSIGENATEIIRRFIIGCFTQGFFITLHRPYRGRSEFSNNAVINASWMLAAYQSQITALSDVLEPYGWLIEEFIDPHLFRGVLLLGASLDREPDNPLASTIIRHLEVSAQVAKTNSVRNRNSIKTHKLISAVLGSLAQKNVIVQEVASNSHVGSTSEGSPDGQGWGMDMDMAMGDVLAEPMFNWDEYLNNLAMDVGSQQFG
jgi:hypothetical protein